MSDGPRPFARRSFLGCALAAAGERLAGAVRAPHCIFILMAGGPSQADLFDFEEGPWTPRSFSPITFRGLRFPGGLMPRLAEQLDSVSFLRGMRAPSTTHSVAQARLPALVSVGISGAASVYGRGCAAEAPAECGFEEACLAARRRVRAADAGIRVGITMGGWDSHQAIYEAALNARDPNSVARRFDAGLGALLAGLSMDGLLSETLVVAMGEFGRVPGPLNVQGGRDHYLYHSALVAGAGTPGGQVIGPFSGAPPGLWS